MFQALFYSILKGVCQFETKIIPTASSKKFYKRTSLVVSYWYKIIIIGRIRMISLNVLKDIRSSEGVLQSNSNNNNLPTRAIFRQQPCLYNSNGHLSKVAISLQWPALYNGHLSLQWILIYKSQLSVQWPPIYYSQLYTMAKPLSWLCL